MASFMRKAMLYLGLGPDEEYDDYETGAERARAGHPSPAPEREMVGAIRTINPVPMDPAMAESARPSRRNGPQVVRPIPPDASARPHVVVPESFNQAQEVADKFKGNQPVIVNLQAASREVARRLIDFASGLCYGLAGNMDRVAKEVYLLTPADVEVSEEERRRLRERGLRDA
jgi:cell division inhibitor SepF